MIFYISERVDFCFIDRRERKHCFCPKFRMWSFYVFWTPPSLKRREITKFSRCLYVCMYVCMYTKFRENGALDRNEILGEGSL